MGVTRSRWIGAQWTPAQDERRAILEKESAHVESGMAGLAAVAWRLYQRHDPGEPFDFLSWFKFVEADTDAFDTLLHAMRRPEEWRYVDREVELRLNRSPAGSARGVVRSPQRTRCV